MDIITKDLHLNTKGFSDPQNAVSEAEKATLMIRLGRPAYTAKLVLF